MVAACLTAVRVWKNHHKANRNNKKSPPAVASTPPVVASMPAATASTPATIGAIILAEVGFYQVAAFQIAAALPLEPDLEQLLRKSLVSEEDILTARVQGGVDVDKGCYTSRGMRDG